MKEKGPFYSINEFARQIHRILKESYPDNTVTGEEVRKYITADNSSGLVLKYEANIFAGKFGFKTKDLINKIFTELMIEYEKNWHDRTFFRILKTGEAILIEATKEEIK